MLVNQHYKILLPRWVFEKSNSEQGIRYHAEKYLEKGYPNRKLLMIDGKFAVCKAF